MRRKAEWIFGVATMVVVIVFVAAGSAIALGTYAGVVRW